jgi:two-component system, sensor histidine kinase and response regulator
MESEEKLNDQRSDKILLLSADSQELEYARRAIIRQMPMAVVVAVGAKQGCREALQTSDFDLVILDGDLADLSTIDLIHQLKLRDYDPAVLVVSSLSDPRVIAEIYNAGCHKHISKEKNWGEEIGQAVRHLLRIKRLEEENRRLLARLTEANQLLAEKNRRLDDFSATVAHDIRGPLGGMIMKLEYILESEGTKLDPRCSSLVHSALASAERLANLVQAMYEWARLGSKAGQGGPVALRDLIEEVVSDMLFEEALDIKLGIDDLPVVWGSSELLRRVFINLISNAVKYNDKPEIVINIGVERFVETSIAPFCEIFVQDNGPGIEAEDLEQIFSLFGRGTAERAGKEGLGIGLSAVKRIVELHYGSVQAQSMYGQGAKFILRLPLEKIDFL